jgi:hypothetical protein
MKLIVNSIGVKPCLYGGYGEDLYIEYKRNEWRIGCLCRKCLSHRFDPDDSRTNWWKRRYEALEEWDMMNYGGSDEPPLRLQWQQW